MMGAMVKPTRIPWGAVATLSGEALTRGIMTLFQFLVANRLGAAGYGTLGLVLSYASILLPVADLGLNGLALRHLANNPDPLAFRRPFALKLLTTGVYLAVLAFGPLLRPLSGAGLWALTMAGIYFAFTSLSDFMRQTLRAKEASLLEFRARLVFLALFIPCCVALWFLPWGITGVLLLYAIPVMGLSVAYLVPLGRVFARRAPDWPGAFELLRAEKRFLIQSVAYLFLVNAASRVDLWILGWGADSATVGVYFAAYNMVFAGIFFGQALSAHMYPRLHRGEGGAASLMRTLAAHIGLAVLLIAGVAVLGAPVFKLIYRQPGFAAGTDLMLGMGVLLGLSILNYVWLSLAIGKNVQWVVSIFLVLSVAIKLVLGTAWVPESGALGMLCASLWAEIPTSLLCGMVVSWIYLRRPLAGNQA
jgi:O-antigen/teichoic acid export membrane protein